jgi:hypothetical protein
MPSTSLALGFGQRLAKTVHQTLEEATRCFGAGSRILIRYLAVQLVPVRPDRNEEHVHAPRRTIAQGFRAAGAARQRCSDAATRTRAPRAPRSLEP